VEGLGGEVEGCWRTRGVKKACGRVKRRRGVARRPFSGRRHAREERDGGGGPVGVRPREGGGGAGHGTRSSWGPRTRACAVGRRQPGDGGTVLRAGEAGEEREKGEGGGDR
jgi:hypothetical protein